MIRMFLLCLLAATVQGHAASWNEHKQNTLRAASNMEGWCTPEKAERLMELVKNTQPDVCVEVGIFGGKSFLPMVAAMEYNKKGIGYAIDPWAVQPCLVGNSGANYEWWSKVDLNKIMYGFMDHMHANNLDKRYCLMRMTSEEAVNIFPNESISILHIDGNHAEESALKDVKNWRVKVKKGGYIIFDDANWPTTQKAVQYLMKHCTLDASSKMGDPYLLFRK